MKKWKMPGTKVIIAAVIAILLLFGIGGYNNLVNKRESVRKSLSNIETQYQRRTDLVPNLVSTVKGAANFEQETLNQVVEARAKATSVQIDPSKATPAQIQQYMSAQGELSQALGRLLLVVENYPQLQSVNAFRDLQVQLEGTENRIAVARKDFNDEAAGYNAKTKRFPTNIVAGLFNFDEFPYFEAERGSNQTPDVNFGQ